MPIPDGQRREEDKPGLSKGGALRHRDGNVTDVTLAFP